MNMDNDEGSISPSAISWARDWPTGGPDRLEIEATPRYSFIEWPPDPVTREAVISHVEGDPVAAPWWKAYAPDELALLDTVETILDVPPITEPQVQGDVFVLPWLETTTPSLRADRVDAAVCLAVGGSPVTGDGSHVLLTEPGSRTPPRYLRVGKGHTLGTLVVDAGSAARLSHHEHGDLLIGPGVYVLHQQRVWQGRTATPAAD